MRDFSIGMSGGLFTANFFIMFLLKDSTFFESLGFATLVTVIFLFLVFAYNKFSK